jgi:4-oxalocrotonate tautomerase
MPVDDFQTVNTILLNYFKGLHEADTKLLAKICSEQLVLYSPDLRRSRDEWFAAITSRSVPLHLGDVFEYKVLSLDIVGSQAMAKLACPLLGHNYIDFIGLLKEHGRWKIISKMYCDTNPE